MRTEQFAIVLISAGVPCIPRVMQLPVRVILAERLQNSWKTFGDSTRRATFNHKALGCSHTRSYQSRIPCMQCMLNLEIRSLIEMLNLGQMTLIYRNYLVLNQYQLRVEAWGWWHLKMVTVDLAPLRSRPLVHYPTRTRSRPNTGHRF